MHDAIKWLRRATLRAKLTLLVALAALAVAGSIGLAASLLHERMFNDRIDKLVYGGSPGRGPRAVA